MDNFRFFIAHSERDGKFIRKFCGKLDAVGLNNYYLAERPEEFNPNKPLAATIKNELDKKCQCVVGIITARSCNSPWVNQEMGYASGSGKEIVIILEEGIKEPPLVSAHQYASFLGENLSSDIRLKVIPYLKSLKEQEEKDG